MVRKQMDCYNKLKLKALSMFASTDGEWLRPGKAAERLNFLPPRSAWSYFKLCTNGEPFGCRNWIKRFPKCAAGFQK